MRVQRCSRVGRPPTRESGRRLASCLRVLSASSVCAFCQGVLLASAEPASSRLELSEDAVLIDCDGCVMRDLACADCVVTVVLGAPPGGVDVDVEERRALDVLADSGLVPRLRLVPFGPPPEQARPASAAS